mgnify:CR=1 FL=1
MANISVRCFSEALKRNVHFEMYLPNDKPDEQGRKMKTLFLLHGYAGDAGIWVPEHIAQKYNIAVVAPNGENGFWLDGLSTGHKYCTFVGVELVDYLRRTFGLAKSADETCIIGLSMGGFGALHTAFAYPDTFGKTAAMSSALVVHEIAHMKQNGGNGIANYDYYHECFGDLETVEESDSNPEVLVKRLKDSGKAIPEIFMSCGTEDFLLENNREFHHYLESIDVPHTYIESTGNHDMAFWGEYTEKFIEMMFGGNND